VENQKIRSYAKNKKVPLWAVADELGVSEASMTRLLRHPLDKATAKRITDAINHAETKAKEARRNG
jgi:hypothetical protein